AWVQVGSDINGEAAFDNSGNSVSLSSNGSRVAIGALYNGGGGTNAGQVRVYDLTGGGAWVQVGSDINGEAAFDNSGNSVSLSSNGSRVAIGALLNDGGGTNAGQVRILDYLDSGGGITSEPRSLKVAKKKLTSRTLSWNVPVSLNGGSITDYIIQYRVGGTTRWSTFTDGISTSRKVKVTGLTRGVKYQFQVAAHTAEGDSPYSAPTKAS
ncbi:MAG: hypothetical protein F2605_04660, partial [Actinobacteria bacterium]|nr:hypothetical protein [Actinomycetota bacterium]